MMMNESDGCHNDDLKGERARKEIGNKCKRFKENTLFCW